MTSGDQRKWLQGSLNSQSSYYDMYVSKQGITADAKIPESETRDQYNERVTTYKEAKISLIPKFEEYYQTISIIGISYEDPLPLECIVKSNEHIPQNTLIQISTTHPNDEDSIEWWEVISVSVRRYNRAYSRIALCVPYREDYNA